MKKLYLLSALMLCACAHTAEQVIGYNEDGKTIIRVCKSRGTTNNATAFGSKCTVELRDYGRVSNASDTINIISKETR